MPIPSPTAMPDPVADGRANSSTDGGADPGVVQSTHGVAVGKPPTPVGGADPGVVAHADPVADDRAASVADDLAAWSPTAVSIPSPTAAPTPAPTAVPIPASVSFLQIGEEAARNRRRDEDARGTTASRYG